MANTILVEVDSELYEKASRKVEDINKYIEQELRLLVDDDFTDEYETLVELSEKMDEIRELETRLVNLRNNRVGNVIDTDVFDDVMVTIMRIHDNLDMIGKNQIRQLSKVYHVPYDSLLEYVEKCGLNIVNYTGVSKK